MKKLKYIVVLGLFASLLSCKNTPQGEPTPEPPQLSEVTPVDINEKGFELLTDMQGHWVGKNKVMSFDYPWFAFDYRAISPSHVFGIFEGGTMGNLFTSFFITDYKGKRTIMARNGGLLNGIYRTSYFVLDSVKESAGEKYYRLVDAQGGENVMFMELRFKNDSLHFDAYTSRLGLNKPATHHMDFDAVRHDMDLANAAANDVGFPQNVVEKSFADGFNLSWMYTHTGDPAPQSATFMAQSNDKDVYQLANSSGDPFRIDQHAYLSALEVELQKNSSIQNQTCFLFLSKAPLTNNSGYFDWMAFDSILLFPELVADQDEFLVTYLHPGDYFVTVVADASGDGVVSMGDISSISKKITIAPEKTEKILIDNINVQN